MNFDELNKKLGGCENLADWRQAQGGGWLNKTAKVDDEFKICDNAIIWGSVFDNALVFGDARVFGNALVSGDARKQSPLFIVGSRFSLTNCKKGHIHIGCQCHPFKWWLSKAAQELAEEYEFTAAEINEYREYIKLFIAIGK